MNLTLALLVGALTAIGVYLATSRALTRIVLGFSLLGHAAVIGLLVAGGRAGEAPVVGDAEPEELSNPLPQALSLTAIVIAFGLSLFLLALARRSRQLTDDDLVEDDLEDKRIAAAAAEHDPPFDASTFDEGISGSAAEDSAAASPGSGVS